MGRIGEKWLCTVDYVVSFAGLPGLAPRFEPFDKLKFHCTPLRIELDDLMYYSYLPFGMDPDDSSIKQNQIDNYA